MPEDAGAEGIMPPSAADGRRKDLPEANGSRPSSAFVEHPLTKYAPGFCFYAFPYANRNPLRSKTL
jgi:hypothetical protein